MIDGQYNVQPLKRSEEIYSSTKLYPELSYNYRTTTGLKDGEHVVFLTIEYYPIRYSPNNNILYYHEIVNIDIIYEKPEK